MKSVNQRILGRAALHNVGRNTSHRNTDDRDSTSVVPRRYFHFVMCVIGKKKKESARVR